MRRYTQEQKQFIADNVVGRKRKELLELVNNEFDLDMTLSKLSSYLKNNKLRSGTSKGGPKGPKLFTTERVEFIRNNTKGISNIELTIRFNNHFELEWSVQQIKNAKARHGIRSGLTGRFEKGHVPANKGTKGLMKANKTSFKPKQVPYNYRKVGAERINAEGYAEIKVADPNKWKFKHIAIWEKHNGLVPKSHVVIFGDRDKQNFDINNLILVSRKQLLGLNRHNLIQTDADLTRTGIIIADLQSKISERRSK